MLRVVLPIERFAYIVITASDLGNTTLHHLA
jgi:hypothetical protein